MRRNIWIWWCWFMATRPIISGMASGLVLLSYPMAGQNLHNALLPALEVFLISAATMVQNNYVDRKHDTLDKRTHAFNYPLGSLLYAYVMWLMAISTTVYVAIHYQSVAYMGIGLTLCVIGVSYSSLRRYTMASALATSVAGSGVIGFAWSQHLERWELGWWLLCILSILFSRENIKDLPHIKIDFGWKRTIAAIFGWEVAVNTSQLCLVSAYCILLGLRDYFTPAAWLTCLLGLTVVINLVRFQHRASYYLIDLAVLFPMAFNAWTGPFPKQLLALFAPVVAIPPIRPPGAPITPTAISGWVRPTLTGAFVLVVFLLRFAVVILTKQDIQLAIVEGCGMTISASAVFILLAKLGHRVSKPIATHEHTCTTFYLLVKRMAIGMGIGVAAISGLIVASIPVWLTGSGLAAWATLQNPRLCRILRDRATQLGIYIGIGISAGTSYAILSLGIALAVAGVIYYTHQGLKRPATA